MMVTLIFCSVSQVLMHWRAASALWWDLHYQFEAEKTSDFNWPLTSPLLCTRLLSERAHACVYAREQIFIRLCAIREDMLFKGLCKQKWLLIMEKSIYTFKILCSFQMSLLISNSDLIVITYDSFKTNVN